MYSSSRKPRLRAKLTSPASYRRISSAYTTKGLDPVARPRTAVGFRASRATTASAASSPIVAASGTMTTSMASVCAPGGVGRPSWSTPLHPEVDVPRDRHGRTNLRCEVGIDRATLLPRGERHLVVQPHLVQRRLAFPDVG